MDVCNNYPNFYDFRPCGWYPTSEPAVILFCNIIQGGIMGHQRDGIKMSQSALQEMCGFIELDKDFCRFVYKILPQKSHLRGGALLRY
jgi:hypothetical protein